MKLISNIATIDKKAIEELGIPSLLLMEEAGRRVAVSVNRIAEEMGIKMPLVTIVSGRGNNGGDGFVSARRLAMLGTCRVVVLHTASPSEMSGDALTNFNLLKHYPVTVLPAIELNNEIEKILESSDFIIDALFGSGISRPVEGVALDLIEAINSSRALIVAVDLPSAVDGPTGNIFGEAVRADYTVTFAAPKPGLFLFPGKDYSGQVEVADIGIPITIMDEDPSEAYLLTKTIVKSSLPKRKKLSHKYSYGTVIVVAGSRNMPGAGVMAAESVLRAGAGVVILASPESVFSRMQLPAEIITLPLPETKDGIISPNAMDTLKTVWSRVTTVALGPGLTYQPSALYFVEKFLAFLHSNFEGTTVVDADGLNCLSLINPPAVLSSRFVLTPHLGECSRLTGMDINTIQNDLMVACKKTSDKYQAPVVLKSASTVICDTIGRFWINFTGNSGMATAGSGDVLTGLIAGFAAQGLPADQAASVATYLHGLAGNKAAEELTPYSLTATDLIRYLPAAIKELQS